MSMLDVKLPVTYRDNYSLLCKQSSDFIFVYKNGKSKNAISIKKMIRSKQYREIICL